MADKIIVISESNLEIFIQEVIGRLAPINNTPDEDEWIDEKSAMFLLKISSKSSLLKYRNQGRLVYSKLSSKKILYLKSSIMTYLQRNSRDTF